MSLHYVVAWLTAFAFTQLIEVPIYRRAFSVSVPVAFGASALTHPLIWFAIFPSVNASYLLATGLCELFAWLAEAAYFAWLFRRPRALVVSLVANAASLSLGLLSHFLHKVAASGEPSP